MQKYGYSWIALTIALVLGGMVEATYHQSMTTFGAAGFFTRPIALTLLVLTIVSLVWPMISNKRKQAEGRSLTMVQLNERSLFSGLLFLFAGSLLYKTIGMKYEVALVPRIVGFEYAGINSCAAFK